MRRTIRIKIKWLLAACLSLITVVAALFAGSQNGVWYFGTQTQQLRAAVSLALSSGAIGDAAAKSLLQMVSDSLEPANPFGSPYTVIVSGRQTAAVWPTQIGSLSLTPVQLRRILSALATSGSVSSVMRLQALDNLALLDVQGGRLNEALQHLHSVIRHPFAAPAVGAPWMTTASVKAQAYAEIGNIDLITNQFTHAQAAFAHADHLDGAGLSAYEGAELARRIEIRSHHPRQGVAIRLSANGLPVAGIGGWLWPAAIAAHELSTAPMTTYIGMSNAKGVLQIQGVPAGHYVLTLQIPYPQNAVMIPLRTAATGTVTVHSHGLTTIEVGFARKIQRLSGRVEGQAVHLAWRPYPGAAYYQLSYGPTERGGTGVTVPFHARFDGPHAVVSLQQLDADWAGAAFAQHGPLPSTLLGPLADGRLHWNVQAYDARGRMISSSSASLGPVTQMYGPDLSIALPAGIAPQALVDLVDHRRYGAAKTFLWQALHPQFAAWRHGSPRQKQRIGAGATLYLLRDLIRLQLLTGTDARSGGGSRGGSDVGTSAGASGGAVGGTSAGTVGVSPRVGSVRTPIPGAGELLRWLDDISPYQESGLAVLAQHARLHGARSQS